MGDHLLAVLKVVPDTRVFIIDILNNLTLAQQVLVGILHDLSCLVTLCFDIFELVVHIVEFSGAMDELLPEVFVEFLLSLQMYKQSLDQVTNTYTLSLLEVKLLLVVLGIESLFASFEPIVDVLLLLSEARQLFVILPSVRWTKHIPLSAHLIQ